MVTMTDEESTRTAPSTALSSSSRLGEMLAQYAQHSRVLDDICDSCTRDMDSYVRGNDYVSVLKHSDGTPILPPVMTYAKREEMKMWRQRAVLAETRMKNRHLARTPGKKLPVMESSNGYPAPSANDREVAAVVATAPPVSSATFRRVRSSRSSSSVTPEKKDDSPETLQKDFEEVDDRFSRNEMKVMGSSTHPASHGIVTPVFVDQLTRNFQMLSSGNGSPATGVVGVPEMFRGFLGDAGTSGMRTTHVANLEELARNLPDLTSKFTSSTSSSISAKTVIENVRNESAPLVRGAPSPSQNASLQSTADSTFLDRSNLSAHKNLNLLDGVDFDEELDDIELNVKVESRNGKIMSNQSSSDLESLLGEYQSLPVIGQSADGNRRDDEPKSLPADETRNPSVVERSLSTNSRTSVVSDTSTHSRGSTSNILTSDSSSNVPSKESTGLNRPTSTQSRVSLHSRTSTRSRTSSVQSRASVPRLSLSEEFSHEIHSNTRDDDNTSSVDLKQFMRTSYVLEKSSSCGLLLDDADATCATIMDEEFPGSDYEESLPDLPEEKSLDEQVEVYSHNGATPLPGTLLRTRSFIISKREGDTGSNGDGLCVPNHISDRVVAEYFHDGVLPEKPMSFVNSPQHPAFQREKIVNDSIQQPSLVIESSNENANMRRCNEETNEAKPEMFATSPPAKANSKAGCALKRRNSYDLLTPSPALLKAQVEKDRMFYEAAATAAVTPLPSGVLSPIESTSSPLRTTGGKHPDACTTPTTMRKLVFQSQPDFTSDCLVLPAMAMASVVNEERNDPHKPVLLQPSGFTAAAVADEVITSGLERETSFDQIQSHLIYQQRAQLAALLGDKSGKEVRSKSRQRSVVGRLFGGDTDNFVKKEAGSDLKDCPMDRSTSDGSLDVGDNVRDGVKFLKLVDGGVEYSDYSSPETPSQPKGSVQDLTWDEMADVGQFDGDNDNADEDSLTTLSLVRPLGSERQNNDASHRRLSALVKGHLTRRLAKVESVRELRFSFGQLLELRTMLSRSNVVDGDLASKTDEQIYSIRSDIHEVFFNLSIERRLALIRNEDAKKLNGKCVSMAGRGEDKSLASDPVNVFSSADARYGSSAHEGKITNDAPTESKNGKGVHLKKLTTPHNTPAGARRALGFSSPGDDKAKGRTALSPKAKPWK